VERLHAGDDSKLAESRNVRGGDSFNVLDARPSIMSVVPRFGIFIGVQRRPNGVIADRMREKLQAALVQLRDCHLVVRRLPEKLSFQGGVIAVGLKYRRGVRFDDAIHHEFNGAGIDPVVVEFLAGVFDGLEVLRPQLWRIEEVSDIHAQGEVTAAPHFVEKIERFKILPSTVDASDAVFICPFHARAQSQEFFGARRLWNDLGDQVLSRLF